MPLKPYKNLAGDSGVTAYEIKGRSIIVQFREGHLYRYTYASAGKTNIENMKELATTGRGLSTYITQHVREWYAEKIE